MYSVCTGYASSQTVLIDHAHMGTIQYVYVCVFLCVSTIIKYNNVNEKMVCEVIIIITAKHLERELLSKWYTQKLEPLSQQTEWPGDSSQFSHTYKYKQHMQVYTCTCKYRPHVHIHVLNYTYYMYMYSTLVNVYFPLYIYKVK